MSDLFGKHIVGFPTRRLIFSRISGSYGKKGKKAGQRNIFHEAMNETDAD